MGSRNVLEHYILEKEACYNLFLFFFSFEDRVSPCSPGCLELKILLHLPPECWDYWHAQPHQDYTLFFFFNDLQQFKMVSENKRWEMIVHVLSWRKAKLYQPRTK
jgi:hypothetical protein